MRARPRRRIARVVGARVRVVAGDRRERAAVRGRVARAGAAEARRHAVRGAGAARWDRISSTHVRDARVARADVAVGAVTGAQAAARDRRPAAHASRPADLRRARVTIVAFGRPRAAATDGGVRAGVRREVARVDRARRRVGAVRVARAAVLDQRARAGAARAAADVGRADGDVVAVDIEVAASGDGRAAAGARFTTGVGRTEVRVVAAERRARRTRARAAGLRAVAAEGIGARRGTVARIGPKTQSFNFAFYPEVGDAPISVRGNVAPGQTRHYQAWYRDSPGLCGSPAPNMSNAVSITWQ